MKNVTPASGARRNQILLIVAAVLFVVIIVRACAPHENKYESIVEKLTVALQHNDVDEVKKYQNAETAASVNRARVGKASDFFNRFGKIKRVKETGVDGEDHTFRVTFDKGAVDERVRFDSENKVVHFKYEPVQG